MRQATLAGLLALLMGAIALPAAAQDKRGITAYQEVIELAPDGSAKVTTNLTLSGWNSDKLELPLNFAKAQDFTVAAKDINATATAGKSGDVNVIKLQFDRKPAAEEKLTITFTAKDFFDWKKARSPSGIYKLSYTFTNATPTNIGKYTLQLLLPAGYRMSGVTSSTPKATGEDVESPYAFATEDNHTVLTLRSKSIAAGKNAAIAFGFETEARNPAPVIVIGIIIAAAALYLKRDVLTRADYAREAVG